MLTLNKGLLKRFFLKNMYKYNVSWYCPSKRCASKDSVGPLYSVTKNNGKKPQNVEKSSFTHKDF